jgi:hypothetical protein
MQLVISESHKRWQLHDTFDCRTYERYSGHPLAADLYKREVTPMSSAGNVNSRHHNNIDRSELPHSYRTMLLDVTVYIYASVRMQ